MPPVIQEETISHVPLLTLGIHIKFSIAFSSSSSIYSSTFSNLTLTPSTEFLISISLFLNFGISIWFLSVSSNLLEFSIFSSRATPLSGSPVALFLMVCSCLPVCLVILLNARHCLQKTVEIIWDSEWSRPCQVLFYFIFWQAVMPVKSLLDSLLCGFWASRALLHLEVLWYLWKNVC